MDFENKENLKLIKYLIIKDDINIIKILNNSLTRKGLNQYITPRVKEQIYNYLSIFIFIVSDLDNFKNSLKNTIDMGVNQGPQKDRVNGSYISQVLFQIDKGFRDSMYNHNRMYLEYRCEPED